MVIATPQVRSAAFTINILEGTYLVRLIDNYLYVLVLVLVLGSPAGVLGVLRVLGVLGVLGRTAFLSATDFLTLADLL